MKAAKKADDNSSEEDDSDDDDSEEEAKVKDRQPFSTIVIVPDKCGFLLRRIILLDIK